MVQSLKVDGKIGRSFKSIMEERLGKADELLANADGDLETAIHDARKQFKACRSLIRLVRHVIPKDDYKAINQSLRDAGRTISELRDTHALYEAIDLLVQESGLKTDARKPLRKAADRASGALEQSDRRKPDELIKAARGLIAPLPKRVKGLDLPDNETKAYVGGLGRSYREARKALKRGFETRVPEDLHDARKRVINWRYQLDLVSPIWKPVIKSEVKELQALREHLGNHNDVVMLERALESGEPPWGRLAKRDEWVARSKELRSSLVDRAERASSLLFAESPKRHAGRIGLWWDAVRDQS